jgi:hypothetical protein
LFCDWGGSNGTQERMRGKFRNVLTRLKKKNIIPPSGKEGGM